MSLKAPVVVAVTAAAHRLVGASAERPIANRPCSTGTGVLVPDDPIAMPRGRISGCAQKHSTLSRIELTHHVNQVRIAGQHGVGRHDFERALHGVSDQKPIDRTDLREPTAGARPWQHGEL